MYKGPYTIPHKTKRTAPQSNKPPLKSDRQQYLLDNPSNQTLIKGIFYQKYRERNVEYEKKIYDGGDILKPFFTDAPIIRDPIKQIRVLVFGYMRGGTSLLGELLNQDRDTFYMFEPVDGIYSSMYGTTTGWKPIDIQYNDEAIRR